MTSPFLKLFPVRGWKCPRGEMGSTSGIVGAEGLSFLKPFPRKEMETRDRLLTHLVPKSFLKSFPTKLKRVRVIVLRTE
jgi:hypothetical protein